MRRIGAFLLMLLLVCVSACCEETLPAPEASPSVLSSALPCGCLPCGEQVPLDAGDKYAVYSGPGEDYVREADGRALVSTAEPICVYGRDGSWLLVSYDISENVSRFGYVRASILPTGQQFEELEFAYLPGTLLRAACLTDDPLNDGQDVRDLAEGEQVMLLSALNEDWYYVEITRDEYKERGFLPVDCLTVVP